MDNKKYCQHLTKYQRLKTIEVEIGNIKIGGENPIVLQSMTNHRPLETEGNVEQSIRIINAGAQIVRLTAPTAKDAENLKNIKASLVSRGYNQPLVADIHFNPGAAIEAAKWVEKVRINPGNFAEANKTKVEYTDGEYSEALNKIKEKFGPLVEYCNQNKVALRIGSNHGSLSQRIMSRYGDTPKGMVEAAMEYLQMAMEMNFFNLVISMKASNIRVMVQAYRYLVHRMMEEKMNFPIHLGVTEAGNEEDGIIKSAAGNGALLYDGIGDTIRVSLTDEPENEIPIAKEIVEYAKTFQNHEPIDEVENWPLNPFEYQKREVRQVKIFGGKNLPMVMGYDCEIINENTIKLLHNSYEIIKADSDLASKINSKFNFIELDIEGLKQHLNLLKNNPNPIVLIFTSENKNWATEIRRMFIYLIDNRIELPVVLRRKYEIANKEQFMVRASMDMGPIFIDGLADGIWIENSNFDSKMLNDLGLSLLQASRTRFTRTDFISCPSCGRTLFDLQEATSKIKEATGHLSGLKIGIMGCIVNGPGEMADADFGYVGSAPGHINLYKGKEVVRKNVPQDDAVNQLIDLIKENGDWVNKN
jgi:(E)-4-hydroxy-3-methylbut-2-enyl-diphosphate synthase